MKLIRKYKNARWVTQLLVGIYMLVYLGLISGENMQIEGFWYYLFMGVFILWFEYVKNCPKDAL